MHLKCSYSGPSLENSYAYEEEGIESGAPRRQHRVLRHVALMGSILVTMTSGTSYIIEAFPW